MQSASEARLRRVHCRIRDYRGAVASRRIATLKRSGAKLQKRPVALRDAAEALRSLADWSMLGLVDWKRPR